MAATDGIAADRIEIVGERRRAYAPEFRARLVSESLTPGARVGEVARRHGLSPSLIYRWRRLAGEGGGNGTRLLAVRLVPAATSGLAPARLRTAALASQRAAVLASDAERIEIELSDGIRLRVGNEVSLPALRRVLAALRE